MDSAFALLLQGAPACYLAGVIAAALLMRREALAVTISFGCALVGAALGAVGSIAALGSGAVASTRAVELWPSLIPYVRYTVRADALSTFFLLVLSVLGVALSVYSLGYTKAYLGRKPAWILALFYNLLLLATHLVFLAENAFFFLMVWEIMALAAYCLVSFEHEHEETRSAGVLFFVMSHLGTGCLILGFLVLFQASGDYEFGGFRAAAAALSPGRRDLVFLLFLIGFGIKAGVVPLHIWLPAAHPVAPSNISALMSGVLIKTGIYGLTRVFFDFLGTPALWWGSTVLTLGTISAVLGVLYALMEHDLKRLLAYHSIENIGIILMGLGASMMFLHSQHPALAALALLAGLYHTINHALFKALLFLGAGAVLHSTGTRNMEEMGGLIRRMPRTAFFFLLGAVAISALPPLNGFVSEWLTYQSLLQGFSTTDSLVRLVFPIGGAMLALTGALAAACFVKAFGIAFLAQPRSPAAASAHEVGLPMLTGQALLAVACVLLGLFPTVSLKLLDPVTQQFAGHQLSSQLSMSNGLVLGNLAPKGGTVSTLGMTIAAGTLLVIPFLLRMAFSRKTSRVTRATWDCGLRGLTPQMQYSATGFSKPIRMIFKALFRPRREVQREYDYSPYFAKNIRFESHVEEVFERRFYRPVHGIILRVSRRMRALQAGSIQAYLIYIFAALVVLLMVAL